MIRVRILTLLGPLALRGDFIEIIGYRLGSYIGIMEKKMDLDPFKGMYRGI